MAPVRLAEVAIQESLVSDHALAMCSWKSIDFHRSIEAIWTSSAKHLAPVFSILQGATPLGHQLNWLDQSVCLEFRFGDIQPAKVRMFSIRVRHILQVHSKWSFGCSRVTKEKKQHGTPKNKRFQVWSMFLAWLTCCTLCALRKHAASLTVLPSRRKRLAASIIGVIGLHKPHLVRPQDAW